MEKQIKELIPMMKTIINKYKHLDDYDELYSIGMMSLFEAVKTFDPSRGIKISTYAYGKIRYSILNSYKDKDKLIYSDDITKTLSTSNMVQDKTDFSTLYNGIKKLDDRTADIIKDHYGFNGDPMTISDIATKHGISKTRISNIINKGLKDLKLYIEEGD